MSKVIGFLKTRSVAYYLSLLSTVCGLVALIVYLIAGTNQFATTLSPAVIVPFALGLALGIFSAVKTFRLALFGQYLANLYAFISVFIVNITLITNLMYNVDGSTFPVSVVVIALFGLVATFGSLAAGIMTKYGQGSRKQAKEE